MILLQALAALALLLVVQSIDHGNSPIGQAEHMSDSTEQDISQNILNPSNHSMVGRLCPNLMRRDPVTPCLYNTGFYNGCVAGGYNACCSQITTDPAQPAGCCAVVVCCKVTEVMCNSICTGFSCGGGLVSCAAGESCCGTTCPCGSSPPTTDPIDDPHTDPIDDPHTDPIDDPPTDPRTHLSKGEIAGISVGSVAAVAILAFCGFKCHKRLRARRIASRKKNQDNEETKTPDTFEKSS